MRPAQPAPSRLHRQRGIVMLLMLVVLVLGASALLLRSLSSAALRMERDKVTADALAQAKEALIGRAVADANRPGSLPCPDLVTNTTSPILNTPNDGVADSGSPCPSYIGRLPWKSLGLPDLRDGAGERLWYVLSPNFRDGNSNAINSNSQGTLLVYDNSGANLLTPPGSEAVAIIFSAGAVIGSQQRDSANQNNPQNYLDSANGFSNYTATGPFIAASASDSFNDQLLIVRASDIIPAVESRLAHELISSFNAYLAANGNKYPNPANFSSCTASSCPSDPSQCIGKIPVTNPALSALLPTWFTPNKWFDVVYFSTGTNSLSPGGGGGSMAGWSKNNRWGGTWAPGGGGSAGTGTTCYASALNVSGYSAKAVIIFPGSALGTQNRTGSSSIDSTNLAQYFEDAENNSSPPDNVYVFPASTMSSSNDSIYSLP